MFDVLVKRWPFEKWHRSDALDMEGAVTDDKKIRVFWTKGGWKVLSCGIVGTGESLEDARSNWIHRVESAFDFIERIDTTRVGETIVASKRPFLVTLDGPFVTDKSD